jgi:hypothetical protein
MKRLDLTIWARASIIAAAAVAMEAAVFYLVTDNQAETALQNLELARVDAMQHQEQAQKVINHAFPPNIPVSIRAPISPSDKYRIEIMRTRFQALVYRHELAGRFGILGTLLLLALGGLHGLVMKFQPNQSPQPALTTGG